MSLAIIEAKTSEQVEQFRALLLEYGHSMAEPSHSSIWTDIDTLPGRYAPPSGRMLLGFADGKLIGCAALSKLSERDCEMKRVYVSPPYRGRGFGRDLADAVLEHAKCAGYRRVLLSSWNDNAPAIEMYSSMGFAAIQPFKNSHVVDRLVFLGMDMQPVNVFKVSGSDLDDPVFSSRFASVIAEQMKVSARLIIVHGGGKELTELLTALQVETHFVDGLRVTDARTRDAALMVLSGLANKRLVAALLAQGVDAIGVSGLDTGLITAEPLSAALGFVGKPVNVRTDLLASWVGQGIVPVLSPMSIGADGEIYNVNADHVAGAIAAAMDADMLTFVTNVPGVLDANRTMFRSLTAEQTHQLITDGTIFGGMIPKVRMALEALDAGVSKVRITGLDGVTDNTGTVFVK